MPSTESQPRISYTRVGPPAAPMVVFINGVGGVQAAFLLQVKALRAAFGVLTYDHRGLGGSELPGTSPQISDYTADLCRLLDHLGSPRVALVGMSFGGRVALDMALSFPERVAGMVLVGTSCGGIRHDPGDARARAAIGSLGRLDEATWRDVIAPALFGARYRERYPRRIRSLARWRQRHPVDPRAIEAQRHALEAFDVSHRLGAIAVPTLVLHGAEDRLSPPGNARLLAQGIPGARLQLMSEVGHSPNVEAPTEFNQAIQDFLAAALGWPSP